MIDLFEITIFIVIIVMLEISLTVRSLWLNNYSHTGRDLPGSAALAEVDLWIGDCLS